MTDKQITIDGVDVSGCGSYMDNGECISELVYSDYCKVCPNCTYKLEQKLKRKEQECETLASQLDFEVQKKECLEQECEELKIYIESNEQQVKEVETLVMDNDRLINELDQLKAELTRANCQIADDEILQCDMREAIEGLKAENDKFKETFDDLLKVQYQLADSCKKLRQCLTEIKEISMGIMDDDLEESSAYYDAKQILQKISEVENEYN